MTIVSNFISIFFQSFNLFFTDKAFRKMIYKPLFGGFKISMYFTIGWIILSYFAYQYGAEYVATISGLFSGSGSGLVTIVGSALAYILFLPLFVFLYFSFFCDKQYQEVARYGLWLKGVSNNHDIQKDGELKLEITPRNPIISIFQLIFFCFFLIFTLIASFFFPLLGPVFAGLILVWDFASYTFNELEVGYLKRVNFIFDNITLTVFLSFVFGCIVLIPFVILVFYPMGVFITSRFVRISGKFV